MAQLQAQLHRTSVDDQPGIFDVISTCRSIRRVKPDPVPEELLQRLIDAANQAPSASNAQNARWVIVRDPEQRAKLGELHRSGVAATLHGGRARALRKFVALARWRLGSAGGAGAAPADAAATRQYDAFMWQTEHIHEVPALIFACLEAPAARGNTFLAGSAAAGSIWPGVQNLLLAARALGLGAVPTTFILRERAALKSVLRLPKNIEPFCMIPVGYPKGKFGPVQRRPLAEILRWDSWS